MHKAGFTAYEYRHYNASKINLDSKYLKSASMILCIDEGSNKGEQTEIHDAHR